MPWMVKETYGWLTNVPQLKINKVSKKRREIYEKPKQQKKKSLPAQDVNTSSTTQQASAIQTSWKLP